MVGAVGIFVSSSLFYAISAGPRAVPLPLVASESQLAAMTQLAVPGLPSAAMVPVAGRLDLYNPFLRPDNLMLWSLLIAVWFALILHAVTVLRQQHRFERAGAVAVVNALPGMPDTGPPTAQEIAARHRHDNRPSEHAPLALALVLGAIWPWIIHQHQAVGFVMALAMLSLALAAAIRGQRDGPAIRRRQTVGFFGGWATAVTYAAFASLLNNYLGIPAIAATVTAMLLCASAGVITQLRLGGVFSYSVAVIWSLVGLALVTMSADATIAMVAIIGISAMAIVLVRAAS
ncbi:hypothetical protein CUV01_10305 [Paracoccus tegillarcae]|uniref:Uncharacterized protein n=2 Tax=Paracoccus tegillarcae TaxID=1529068 RepID=A0A2K9EHC8_9RHOB|nr:hypothetical protein CUV01_10305 [Paracoccus tegillarcae]